MKSLGYMSILCLGVAFSTAVFAAEAEQHVEAEQDAVVEQQAKAEQLPAESIKVSAATVQAATAAPSVVAEQKKDNTVLISPRTGMRYVVNNPQNLPIIFKTEALAPVTAQNVERISATNPALSQASQQQAQQALMAMGGITPPPAPEAIEVEAETETQVNASAQ